MTGVVEKECPWCGRRIPLKRYDGFCSAICKKDAEHFQKAIGEIAEKAKKGKDNGRRQ